MNHFANYIDAAAATIDSHAQEVMELDQAIGDGDHVSNLQRGLQFLLQQKAEISNLDDQAALQKIGMTLMSKIGGASGSLLGTLFVTMAKNLPSKTLDRAALAVAFNKGVESVQLRGKANKGEKTMLDVLIPVAEVLMADQQQPAELSELIAKVKQTAMDGVEATREMIATKGRASFLGERSKGHLDAGAKSSQLVICAIADVIGG
jgi:phosphoenolpyruvate---glycerone phosphotransferase subunit DhaL